MRMTAGTEQNGKEALSCAANRAMQQMMDTWKVKMESIYKS